MMRLSMVVLWLSCVGATGWCQTDQSRIDSLRQQKTAEFDAQEAACLSRFAVNDCQNEVGVRRRQMLSELKRQENILNDAQRLQKADEQVLRVQAKTDEAVLRQRDAQAAAEKAAQQERRTTLDDKQRAHQEQAKPVRTKAEADKPGSLLDAQAVEKNRAAYQEKQKALEKRRQERDQRVLDQGKGGPPLPAPP